MEIDSELKEFEIKLEARYERLLKELEMEEKKAKYGYKKGIAFWKKEANDWKREAVLWKAKIEEFAEYVKNENKKYKIN